MDLPEQFGLRYEKIAFTTPDGIELKGWFIPSPGDDKRTLIMCHGWGDNKGELPCKLSRKLTCNHILPQCSKRF